MSATLEIAAKKIPDDLRRAILQERLIDVAENLHEFDTPMEYLFDLYHQFIDPAGMFNDFACNKCREKILSEWRAMKPYLEQLEKK